MPEPLRHKPTVLPLLSPHLTAQPTLVQRLPNCTACALRNRCQPHASSTRCSCMLAGNRRRTCCNTCALHHLYRTKPALAAANNAAKLCHCTTSQPNISAPPACAAAKAAAPHARCATPASIPALVVLDPHGCVPIKLLQGGA